jgi:hypothetical protein
MQSHAGLIIGRLPGRPTRGDRDIQPGRGHINPDRQRRHRYCHLTVLPSGPSLPDAGSVAQATVRARRDTRRAAPSSPTASHDLRVIGLARLRVTLPHPPSRAKGTGGERHDRSLLVSAPVRSPLPSGPFPVRFPLPLGEGEGERVSPPDMPEQAAIHPSFVRPCRQTSLSLVCLTMTMDTGVRHRRS